MAKSMTNPDFRPLYVQVKEILIRRIDQGEWEPGEPMPAEPKLAAELGVSQGTVRKALDAIARSKLVVRRQGRGTFIAEHTAAQSLFRFFRVVDGTGKSLIPDSRPPRISSAKASRTHCRKLDLDEGEKVWKIERVRLMKKRPFINESIILPYDLFPGLDVLDDQLPNTLYDFYQRQYGVFIHQAKETLRAVEAEPADASVLKVERGTPLLEISRVAFNLADRPVELRVSRLHTRGSAYQVVLD